MAINKLYLSFAAVVHALEHGRATAASLDNALICCSEYEVNEAGTNDFPTYLTAMQALAAARTGKRLLFCDGGSRGNPITFGEINALLAENGAAPLLMAGGDDDRPLYQIPMHCAVPTVTDGSLEVLWAACPIGKNWRRSWGLPEDEANATTSQVPTVQPNRLSRNRPDSPWRQALKQVAMAFVAEQHGLSPAEVDIDNTGGALTYIDIRQGMTESQTRMMVRLTIAGHMGFVVVSDQESEYDAIERTILDTNARTLCGFHARSASHEVNRQAGELIEQLEREVREALAPHTAQLVQLTNALEARLVLDNAEWQALLIETQPKPVAEEPAA
jgi:hypothetical protein